MPDWHFSVVVLQYTFEMVLLRVPLVNFITKALFSVFNNLSAPLVLLKPLIQKHLCSIS